MRDSDATRVLELINLDSLPGQPEATRDMLDEARAGRAPVDAGWWEELETPRVDVLVDASEQPAGVVSYASRSRDGTGLILWLHGQERTEIIGALVDRALTALHGCAAVEAYDFATALGAGLEALPVRHRRVTAEALTTRGFVARDMWRYMRRDLPAADLPRAEGVRMKLAEGKHQLEVREGGEMLAEATVSVPTAGIGVLWWISVDPAVRGKGLGRRMLGSALDQLTKLGATEAILYVDDDALADDPERGRGAANALYDAAGFVEVDRLCSYRLTQ